jgi:hypothetical protein
MGYFKAVDKLANLAGQHGEFEEAKKVAEEMYAECRAVRLALEQHLAEHRCRFGPPVKS